MRVQLTLFEVVTCLTPCKLVATYSFDYKDRIDIEMIEDINYHLDKLRSKAVIFDRKLYLGRGNIDLDRINREFKHVDNETDNTNFLVHMYTVHDYEYLIFTTYDNYNPIDAYFEFQDSLGL